MSMQEYLYGSVYKVTREDTPKQIECDFEMMRASGMDTVVIWPPVYYWEEKTADYPFATGKKILQIAEKVGIKVIIELAGQLSVFEYIPDSEMKEEYYAKTETGSREWGQSSFGFLNYFHPEVKQKICAFYRATAEAYREFPALAAYDVFNETMFRSFDEHTMAAFRQWLKEKYGTIDELNRVWERTYSEFSQVTYEKHMWMSVMPRADYCAFRKAAIGMILDDWCDAIRQVDTLHPLIADNIHAQATLCGSYDRPQDDYDLKNHVDTIGMSFYPKQVSGTFAPALRHQIFSSFYNASRGEGFLISEMQTHIQALFNPTTEVQPWELKHWCMEAYAAGAKGLIYWMWRPFTKGLQTMGRGLVDYKGRETPRLTMAQSLGEAFHAYGVMKPDTARVGIVYDPLSEDFQRAYTQSYGVDQQIYQASLYGAYKMLFDLNIPCDMIRMADIEKYDAVILSNKLVMTRQESEMLERYISAGGLCIVDGKFGIVDETALVSSQLPGGEANKLTGLDYLDSSCEALEFEGVHGTYNGYYSKELCRVHDAEVLARFADGACAVARKQTGEGNLVTLNTFLFYGYFKEAAERSMDLVAQLLKEKNITPICGNRNLKIKTAQGADGACAVVFNYTDETQTGEISKNGKTVRVSVPGRDVLIAKMPGK